MKIPKAIQKVVNLKAKAEKKLQSIGTNFAKSRSTPEAKAKALRNIQRESGKGY